MVALHVPAALSHARAVGKGRDIAKNKVIAVGTVSLLINPFKDICLHKFVTLVRKTVAAHVALCPVEIRFGHIDGHGVGDTAVRYVAARATRVGKQIAEVAVVRNLFCELTKHVACVAVVQKEPCVERRIKVYFKEQAILVNQASDWACTRAPAPCVPAVCAY